MATAIDLYVLVKYDDEGNPVLEMGQEGRVRYNLKRRIFYNEKSAHNYASNVGGAHVVHLTIPEQDADPYVGAIVHVD